MSPVMNNTEPDDDAPIGRVLTRREVLALLAGLGGAALLAACDPLQSAVGQPTATTAAGAGAGASTATGTALNAEAATAVAATPVAASPTADVAAVPDCVVRPE